MKYTVIGKSVQLTGGVLTLSKEQAADRAHALKEVKGKFEIVNTVEFKQGETFGFEGDMPKTFIDVTVQVVEGKSSKADKAAADKAAADKHLAEVTEELKALGIDFDDKASIEDLESLLEAAKAPKQ